MEDASDKKRAARQPAVQRLLARGIYDDPLILDDIVERILADVGPRSIHADLDRCPVGEGHRYRDLAARVFLRAFSGDIDVQMMRSEFGIAGGRGDLELPFHIRAFDKRPLLRDWRHRFNLSSVLVEVKNEQNPAPPDHVRQIESDVRVSPLGNVGFLVCRNGLTLAAQKRLTEVNKKQDVLLLAFNHRELHELPVLSPGHLERYLHRKELRQLQTVA